jgi:hypothetical protein
MIRLILVFILGGPYLLQAAGQSSVSDLPSYREFCAKAVSDQTVFDRFRGSGDMIGVVELRYLDLGWDYIRYINLYYPFLLDSLREFRKSDDIGDPPLFDYVPFGSFSPNTLRYIKILGDLISFFGDLSGSSILEIGGGFGGQCKILADYFALKEYTIVDLPEPLLLSKKYLDIFGVQNVCYIPYTKIEEKQSDLIISNYAFSELQKHVQDEYFDKLIRHSKAGYMILNYITAFPGFSTYSFDEIYRRLKMYGFEIKVMEEDPSSSPGNKLCIWKCPA